MRQHLAKLTAIHVVTDFYQGAVPALVAMFVLTRGYSFTAAAGITLAATFLASVTQPLFGLWADRRAMGWPIPAGVAIAGTGIGLAGVSTNYVFTWIAIAVSGIGVALFHPEASRQARLAAGESAKGMSVFFLGANIGHAIAPIVVTTVIGVAGMGATPWLAIPALLAAAAYRRTATAASANVRETVAAQDDWRRFGWLTAIVILRSICALGAGALIAVHFVRRFQLDETAAGASLTVFLAAGMAGTLAGGWLADRYTRVTTMRIGYALCFAAMLALIAAPTFPAALTAAAILGAGLYIPFTVQVTLGQEFLPNRVGTASGVTLGLAVSAGGLFAPVLGAVSDHFGLLTAFAVISALLLTAFLLTSRLAPPKQSAAFLAPAEAQIDRANAR